MHQHDRDRSQPGGTRVGQAPDRRCFVEFLQHRAIGHHPLGDLKHAGMRRDRQDDLPHEQLGPLLRANHQRIAKPARYRQQRWFALAFEQRIGRHSCSHPHGAGRQGAGCYPGQQADRSYRGVLCAGGVLG